VTGYFCRAIEAIEQDPFPRASRHRAHQTVHPSTVCSDWWQGHGKSRTRCCIPPERADRAPRAGLAAQRPLSVQQDR